MPLLPLLARIKRESAKDTLGKYTVVIVLRAESCTFPPLRKWISAWVDAMIKHGQIPAPDWAPLNCNRV